MSSRISSVVVLVSVAGLVVPVAPDAGAAAPTCHGHRATIVGPNRPDGLQGHVIRGTRHRDVIVGTRGADTIYARGGNDLVCARSGSDRIFGGSGDDRLHGGRDRAGYRPDTESYFAVGDTVVGGPGDDLIDLGFDPGQTHPSHARRDTVSFVGSAHGVHLDLQAGRATGAGHDVIVDRPGFVWFQGGPHDDRVLGTVGDDRGNLGRGDDVFRGRAGDDFVADGYDADTGRDRVHGGAGDDTLVSASGGDLLDGGAGDDSLTGDHARRFGSPSELQSAARPVDLEGGAGDDHVRLTWVRSGDRVSGGDGTDVLDVVFGDGEGPGRADLTAGTLAWGGDTATMSMFEKYYLNAFAALTLQGSDGPDLVGYAAPGLVADLGAGDDLLTWHPDWADFRPDDASDDTVDGGPGADTVDVGEGDDTCTDVEAGPC